jgi:hypothetical protein
VSCQYIFFFSSQPQSRALGGNAAKVDAENGKYAKAQHKKKK